MNNFERSNKDLQNTLTQEEFSQILKYKVLFGLRTKNKNFKHLYWSKENKYSFLCAELYKKQINDLAQYIINCYEKNLNEKILVLNTQKEYPHLKKFAKLAKLGYYDEKFIPGTFTNPRVKDFKEPAAIFIVHDKKEKQAVIESTGAKMTKTPVLGFNNLIANHRLYTRVVIINNFEHDSIGFSLWQLLKIIERSGHINLESLTLNQFLGKEEGCPKI